MEESYKRDSKREAMDPMEFLNAYCENLRQDCFVFLTNEMPLQLKLWIH